LVAVALNNFFINYCLNKFCPYLLISFLLFYNSGLDLWKGIAVCLACFFLDRFAFKAGYSVAYCESRNIDISPNDE